MDANKNDTKKAKASPAKKAKASKAPAPKPRPISTSRVARHRARMRETEEGDKHIKDQNRANSKKYRDKAKQDQQEMVEKIAHYEKLLGIPEASHSNNPSSGQGSRRPTYLPPVEMLRQMRPADLSAWQKEERAKRKKQSYAKKKGEVAAMKARLATLEEMWVRRTAGAPGSSNIVHAPPRDNVGEMKVPALPPLQLSAEDAGAAKMPALPPLDAPPSDAPGDAGAPNKESGGKDYYDDALMAAHLLAGRLR